MKQVLVAVREKLDIQRRNVSNIPASQQVLHNPELLECLLVQLPERFLLVTAQLVNQLWHSLIIASPTLQQKLYFQPIANVTESRVNPILLELFPPWFRNFGHDPLLHASIKRKDFRALDWNSSPEKREAYRRADASWRRMLVVQPPVLKIEVTKRYHLGGEVPSPGGRHRTRHISSHFEGEATIPDGLRMGVLYDEVQEIAGRLGFAKGSFHCCIQWRRSGSRVGDDGPERIWPHIDSLISTYKPKETPLEMEFRSLAYEDFQFDEMRSLV